MRKILSIGFVLLPFSLLIGQQKSKADDLFFAYAYQQAIAAYESDISEGISLSSVQKRNLADSYFKTGAYDKATEIYVGLNETDSIMDGHHFNKMLQGFSKTGNYERVKAFLNTRGHELSKELFENTEFNNDLMASPEAEGKMDFRIFNLGSNSSQSDFSPAFYKDRLLFTSGRPAEKRKNYEPTGEAFLDIFYGNLDPSGQVAEVSRFEGIPKSEYHKATPFFSEKLSAILYVLSNTEEGELEFDENGKNSLAIGIKRERDDFRFLWKDLSTSFYYPFYDDATDRLYFAANFKDIGYGGTDIYYVNTNNGQIMSAPVNLGPRINSPGNEIAPYIFEGTLYFASDIFYGIGGMDIYKSNIDGATNFSIPVNLGKQINSPQDDFGLIIRNNDEGLLGYFSSNRDGGKGGDDIYGFLVDEKPGLKTVVVSGQVIEEATEAAEENVSVSISAGDGQILAQTTTNEQGNYRIEIPWQERILLQATKNRFSSFSRELEPGKLKNASDLSLDIPLISYDGIVEEKEGQKVLKLRKFYFDRGQTKITPDIALELDKVIKAVKMFPSMQLRIETHTDSRGSSSLNFRLTQARSNAIKKYLIDGGIAQANILYAVGYGEDKILNNCKNGVYCLEMLHKQNQRSLIVVLNDNILFD